jgi:toxin-antitoxin system PIN domain toxin
MIAVDTQILVYAHRGEMPFHAAALNAIRNLANSGEPWAIPWPCAHEFLSVVTRRGIFHPPSTLADGFTALDRWRQSPGLRFIGEGGDHYDRLRQSVERGSAVGALIHDARIAAICISHGVSALWTADRDFSRFPALRTRNPLVS